MTTHAPDVLASRPDTPHRPSPDRLSRLTSWCVRHRWWTLLAAVVVLAGAVALQGLGMQEADDEGDLVGDSGEAVRILDGADFGDVPTESVVLTARDGVLAPTVAQELATDVAARYAAADGVASVGEPVPSADGRSLLLPVELDAATGDDGRVQQVAVDLLDTTAAVADDHPELQVGQVGPGSLDAEVGEALDADFLRAELFSVPVTLLILLGVFGAVVAAGVPVVLGLAAVMTALGLTALVSQVLPVDQNTASLVLLIGLAVGVDYALFVLRRSREERAAGHDARTSVVRAGGTAGRAVLISGVTVVVAMSGMLIAGGLFTSLAVGAMIVVAVSVLASATLLPAVLGILGDGVDRLRMPWRRRRAGRVAREGRPAREGRFWGGLAARVLARRWTALLVAAGVLVALALPALGMRTALFGTESLPRDFASVAALKQLEDAYPDRGTTVDVVVAADAGDRAEVQAALAAGFDDALATGEVVGNQPSVDVSTDGGVSVLHLGVPHDLSSSEAAAAVGTVRDDVEPGIEQQLRSAGVDAEVHVGGGAAEVDDLTGWLDGRLPWVVAFVLVLTFVVMLVSFGSPWLAAATVGLNLLSAAAAFGVMTLVFQNTWAEGLLGFESVGAIAAWLPLMLFVILFGLSMDYHVFVVSRVREAWLGGASATEAVRVGVARSAGVVTGAAAVMIAVFSVFGTLSILEMKQMGVGLAVAVLVDATIVRGVLLPAVLGVLGERAHRGPRWVPALHR